MATKTLTITEDAYEILAREKIGCESFSEVIRREFRQKNKISDFAGLWKDMTDKEYSSMLESIKRSKSMSAKITSQELKKHATS